MSLALRKTLRIFLGFALGLVGGVVAGVCLLILVVAVCEADGGGWASEPQHKFIGVFSVVAANIVPFASPVVGIVIGVIWAVRRNRREASPPGEPPASAGGVSVAPTTPRSSVGGESSDPSGAAPSRV
jgi:hypothetical protein